MLLVFILILLISFSTACNNDGICDSDEENDYLCDDYAICQRCDSNSCGTTTSNCNTCPNHCGCQSGYDCKSVGNSYQCVKTCGDWVCNITAGEVEETTGEIICSHDCDQDNDGFFDGCNGRGTGCAISNLNRDECPNSNGEFNGCECFADYNCQSDYCANNIAHNFYCSNKECEQTQTTCDNGCNGDVCASACVERNDCQNPCMGGCEQGQSQGNCYTPKTTQTNCQYNCVDPNPDNCLTTYNTVNGQCVNGQCQPYSTCQEIINEPDLTSCNNGQGVCQNGQCINYCNTVQNQFCSINNILHATQLQDFFCSNQQNCYTCQQPYILNNNQCQCPNNLCDTGTNCIPQTTYYQDNDQDGFGNPNSQTQSCTQPQNYVENNQDCRDNNARINPNQQELCIN